MAVFERFENQEVRQLKWAVASDSATTFAVGDVVSYTPATKAISKLDSQAAIKTAFSNGLEVYVIAQGDMITYNIPTDYKTYKITDTVNASIGNIKGEKIVAAYLVRTQTNVKFIVGFAIEGIDGDTTKYGKKVEDLQSGLTISDGLISGTSYYVTGYTGFSGDEAEQSGNYIALSANFDEDTTVTGRILTTDDSGSTFSFTVDDKDLVVRLRDVTTGVEFTATKNGQSETFEYSFGGVVRQSE